MGVFFYGCVTLDGYLADREHGLDWLHQTGTTEETDYERFYRGMDLTIMGRRTFREIETAEEVGSLYPTTRNYVFTHSGTLPAEGFIPVSGDVAAFVRKVGKGQNIWVVGGSTILAPLLEQDMVDHMILQIAPVLLGDGIPLFAQKEGLKRFELKEVKRNGQFAELIYDKL